MKKVKPKKYKLFKLMIVKKLNVYALNNSLDLIIIGRVFQILFYISE